MKCHKCLSDNAEHRKFCRECGTLIVGFCQRCGFGNAADDKYCGGCGANRADLALPQDSPPLSNSAAQGTYSSDDILELINPKAPKSSAPVIKKELQETEEISQDMLDSIFNSKDDA